MRLIQTILGLFFAWLYHSLAWSYDPIAALVSLGRWRGWGMSVLPYIEGEHILELGHGPGHLQLAMQRRNRFVLGLDESRQMGCLTAHRMRRVGIKSLNLTRGLTQHLPFASNSFATVVSTFPSEYVADLRTLTEAYRVLIPGGRFVVLPVAWITGKRIHERFIAWLFHVTGEVSDPVGVISKRLTKLFRQAGFQVEVKRSVQKSSLLLIILATKSTSTGQK